MGASRTCGAQETRKACEVKSAARVVLDSNVVLSALLFRRGGLGNLREGWLAQRFVPLVSRETAEELIRVLGYPKFRLSAGERQDLLADFLPYCTTVAIPLRGVVVPACRDPFDRPFLELAVTGKANYLVTGGKDLLSLKSRLDFSIVTPARFIETLQGAS